jgi:hypothetical protein
MNAMSCSTSNTKTGVCFSEKCDLWHMNLFQYRTTQFSEYVSNRVCSAHTHTHTHVTVRIANSVLSYRWRIISRKGKGMSRNIKNISSLEVRNKDRQKLDMFYVLTCIIATPYLLVSCLIRFSSLHTCFPLISPRFYALPKVQQTCNKNAQVSSATMSFP